MIALLWLILIFLGVWITFSMFVMQWLYRELADIRSVLLLMSDELAALKGHAQVNNILMDKTCESLTHRQTVTIPGGAASEGLSND